MMTEDEADAALRQNKANGPALVAKADHLLARSDRRGALAYYEAALNPALSATGNMAALTEHAQAKIAEIQGGMPRHIEETLAEAGFPRPDWHPRFARSLAIMMGQVPRDRVGERFPQMPTAYFYPDLPHLEFADPSCFAWSGAIEAATDSILEESEALSREAAFGAYVRSTDHRPQGDVHGMLENDAWSTLDLTRKGAADEERVARFPATYAAITEHAPLCDITNRSPSIMFSRLSAGSRIPPHTGMINTRLVCHLPLIVPGNGALRVGTETREWTRGKLMVFDDTVEHEAWNHSSADRLVLIFDVWRPEISDIERAQIRALFRAVDTY